jgi:DNA-binding response OmpR family regulator
MRVLVVDAAPAVRSRIAALLAEAGLGVDEAASTADARERVRSAPPDVVVLDVDLPDRGGLAWIPELRGQGISVIVLTNELSYRRHCLLAGAAAFLDKSGEFDVVADVAVRMPRLKARR